MAQCDFVECVRLATRPRISDKMAASALSFLLEYAPFLIEAKSRSFRWGVGVRDGVAKIARIWAFRFATSVAKCDCVECVRFATLRRILGKMAGAPHHSYLILLTGLLELLIF